MGTVKNVLDTDGMPIITSGSTQSARIETTSIFWVETAKENIIWNQSSQSDRCLYTIIIVLGS